MVKPPTRIAVLGATGHAGQAVVRHALKRGFAVTALTRRAQADALQGLEVRVEVIDGGLGKLAEVTAGHDVLVDAAAPYPMRPGVPGSSEWSAQVQGAVQRMETVLDAVRRNGMRVAYISSCTTLPRPKSGWDAAASVWRRSLIPYFEAKAAMEHAVIAAARKGLPAVVVNPAAFVGPWDFRSVEGSFVRSVLERRFPVVLVQNMCVIDVRDVADAIDRALEQELYGQPIPLAGHNVSLSELVVRTCQLAGLPAMPPFPLEPNLVAATAYWMQTAFGPSAPAPLAALSFIPVITDVQPMAPSAEQKALGVKIRPLEESLRDSVHFHRVQDSPSHRVR